MGSAEGMDKVALWSDHIVRHFWHCCSLASEVEDNDLESINHLFALSAVLHVNNVLCDSSVWRQNVSAGSGYELGFYI